MLELVCSVTHLDLGLHDHSQCYISPASAITSPCNQEQSGSNENYNSATANDLHSCSLHLLFGQGLTITYMYVPTDTMVSTAMANHAAFDSPNETTNNFIPISWPISPCLHVQVHHHCPLMQVLTVCVGLSLMLCSGHVDVENNVSPKTKEPPNTPPSVSSLEQPDYIEQAFWTFVPPVSLLCWPSPSFHTFKTPFVYNDCINNYNPWLINMYLYLTAMSSYNFAKWNTFVDAKVLHVITIIIPMMTNLWPRWICRKWYLLQRWFLLLGAYTTMWFSISQDKKIKLLMPTTIVGLSWQYTYTRRNHFSD